MSKWEQDPRAGRYNEPITTEFAVTVATEMIQEWSWDEDAHGYCHTRPILIALVDAVAVIEALNES